MELPTYFCIERVMPSIPFPGMPVFFALDRSPFVLSAPSPVYSSDCRFTVTTRSRTNPGVPSNITQHTQPLLLPRHAWYNTASTVGHTDTSQYTDC